MPAPQGGRAAVLQVNIHEAKTRLSQLVSQVENGEEVVIARAGRPVARIVPLQPVKAPRRLGVWKSRIWVAEDFDSPDPELEAAFHDGPLFPG